MVNARQSEADLWAGHIAALRLGLQLRKPDAVSRVRVEVAKLETQISALALRRELRAQQGLESGTIEARLAWLAARMDDLRGLAGALRSTLLDHDYGCTPEMASMAKEVITGDGECTGDYVNPEPGVEDLNSDMKRAAMDIRSGWSVVTRGASYAMMGRSPGNLSVGDRVEKLRKQYLEFIRELQRKRIQAFPIDDVICNGLSRAECAQKRRCRIEQVYDQLVTGLNLYAEMYPPLSEGDG